MEQAIDWYAEAAENLSNGFSRSETIDYLIEDGLEREEAIQITDSIIASSHHRGMKYILVGIGLVVAILAIIMFWGVISKGIFLGIIGGLFSFAKGISYWKMSSKNKQTELMEENHSGSFDYS